MTNKIVSYRHHWQEDWQKSLQSLLEYAEEKEKEANKDFLTKNNLSYIQGNIIKYIQCNIIEYVVRYKDKNGIEDLKKAKHYLEMLIESEK